MIAPPLGLLSMRFFMKQAVGPGWALVGDSGLHLDPTPGLGIADAVRDAVALSEAIVDGSDEALNLYWRRRDADSLGLFHWARDMGSEGYNNALTRMIFRRAQQSPEMLALMHRMMEREIRPQDMLAPSLALRWLLAESLAGNFAPWTVLGRSVRFAREVVRQQAIVDRALAKAERGELDRACPSFASTTDSVKAFIG